MASVKLTFWGVRGSMATPGPGTVHVGGNTACVEIRADEDLLICDAGTGIRPLGLDLIRRMGKGPVDASILLSHLHLDHYIGLPFFKPLYSNRNRFMIAGPGTAGMGFGHALSIAMRPPYFPVPFSDIPAKLRFKTVFVRPFSIGRIRVVPLAMNHPGGALGWKFLLPGGVSIVHVTDNEPSTAAEERKIVGWMRNADVLIHDAQYDSATYRSRRGWGHSPFVYPIRLAWEAGIPKLYLFHFDPEDDDRHLRKILKESRAWIKRRNYALHCELAREGTTILL